MKDNRNSPHIAIMTAAVITLVSFFFSLGLFPVNANIAKADSDDLLSDLINIISEYSEDDTYAQYYEKYSGGDRPDLTVRIEGEDYTEANGGSFEIVNNYMGLEGSAVLTPESGIISWSAK